MFGYSNYTIQDIQATFEVKDCGPVNMLRMIPFWGSQNLEPGSVQTVSIRRRIWKPVPTNIHIHAILIHYWYNCKMYTYLPDKYNIDWPPKKTLKFTMPIKHAVLLDDKDRIILDLTESFKKLAGPKCDNGFMNRIVRLRLTDVLGNQSSVFVAK